MPTSPWVLFHAIALLCSFWVVWASHSRVLPKGPLTLQRVVSVPVGVTSWTLAMNWGKFSRVSQYP